MWRPLRNWEHSLMIQMWERFWCEIENWWGSEIWRSIKDLLNQRWIKDGAMVNKELMRFIDLVNQLWLVSTEWVWSIERVFGMESLINWSMKKRLNDQSIWIWEFRCGRGGEFPAVVNHRLIELEREREKVNEKVLNEERESDDVL